MINRLGLTPVSKSHKVVALVDSVLILSGHTPTAPCVEIVAIARRGPCGLG